MANQGSSDQLGQLRRLAALIATDGHRFSSAKLTRILEIAEGEEVVEDRKEQKFAETKLGTSTVHENRSSTTREQQSDQVASKAEAETQPSRNSRSTGSSKCSCSKICTESCPCIKSGAACGIHCICKAEGSCKLRAKVFSTLFGSYTGIRVTPCFASFLDRRYADPVEVGSWTADYHAKLRNQFINEILLQGYSEMLFIYVNNIVQLANTTESTHPPPVRTNRGSCWNLASWFEKWARLMGRRAWWRVYELSGMKNLAQKRLMQAYLRLALCADSDQKWYFSCCSYTWVSRDKGGCLTCLSRRVEGSAR